MEQNRVHLTPDRDALWVQGLLPFPSCFAIMSCRATSGTSRGPSQSAVATFHACHFQVQSLTHLHACVTVASAPRSHTPLHPHPPRTFLDLSGFSTIKFSHYISQLQVSTSLQLKIVIDRPHTTLFFFLCVYLSENRDVLFLHLLIFFGS